MGVSLTELVSGRELEIEELKGRKVAIDSFNTIYQFLSSIRDRMTGEPLRDSHGNVTSHLSGLFYRTSRMLDAGIEPIFVFDGEPPAYKKGTIAARKDVRDAAEVKWKQAVREGDTEAVRRYSQQASRLTAGMVDESKRLLGLMGVPWVQAPSEGEAQASHMMRKGLVWAVGSQDWDSLLFGAERLIKNLAITGKRKLPRKETFVNVKPEIIELRQALSNLGISREQLIIIGILVGTDYNTGGVKGIGPKKALTLVREHRSLEAVMKQVAWDFQTSPEQIFEFFINPPASDIPIEKPGLDQDGLSAFLIEEHDFSRERVTGTIEKLAELEGRSRQSSLGSWLR